MSSKIKKIPLQSNNILRCFSSKCEPPALIEDKSLKVQSPSTPSPKKRLINRVQEISYSKMRDSPTRTKDIEEYSF